MSTSQEKKVVLFAVDDYNSPLVLKSCVALLKMKKLASFHLHLTVVTQDEEILSSLVVIKELNHRLFLHNTDLRSDESVQQTIQKVLQVEDKIDILVCHLDRRLTSTATNTKTDFIQNVFEYNFYPNVRVISNVVRHMKREKQGKIIMLNSYAGIQGIGCSSAYCAARFAVNGLVQSVAAEVVSSKISLCTLQTVIKKSPSSILTHEFSDIGNSHQENISNEEYENLLSNFDHDLEKQKLLKVLSSDKVAACLQSLFTDNFTDLRVFVNKSCKKAAYAKFTDPKGGDTLSEITKFYLNIDIDEFRNEVRKKQTKIEILKSSSPFVCRGVK